MRLSGAFCFLTLAAVPLPAQYFPPGVFDKTPQKDESAANYYGKFLKALHEPSLWELSRQRPNAEVYRFLWLRTFHRPIAIRLVVRNSGSGWINSHMTSGKGGDQPGRITPVQRLLADEKPNPVVSDGTGQRRLLAFAHLREQSESGKA